MTVVVVLALVLGVAVSGYFGVRLAGRRRRPRELRGDWWTGFEQEFRAYASKAAAPRRYDRRRRTPGSSGR
jgi:hypothetical protein